MNCPKCGSANPDSAKFCARCGASITETPKIIFCSECGEENKSTNQFCVVCGEKLIRVKKQPVQKAGRNRTNRPVNSKKIRTPEKFWTFGKTLTVSTVLIIAAIFVLKGFQSGESARKTTTDLSLSSFADPVQEARVMNVASKFLCSCGGCDDDPLDTCACETAINQKNFIRQILTDGKTEKEAITAVKQKYGFLKPEFEKEFGNL